MKKGIIRILIWLGILFGLTLLAMLIWIVVFKGSQTTESLKWFQFLQTAGTFLLPPVLCAWIWSEHHQPFTWLKMDKKVPWMHILLAIGIMICAIPAINLLADLNGQIKLPKSLDFIEQIRKTLDCSYVRYTRPAKELIQTVAVCGGSGAEFIETAIEQGADVYLTADCKYHEFQDANRRIGLIDIDHWYSERHAREIFRDMLEPLGVKCIISERDKSPILIKN